MHPVLHGTVCYQVVAILRRGCATGLLDHRTFRGNGPDGATGCGGDVATGSPGGCGFFRGFFGSLTSGIGSCPASLGGRQAM